MITDPVKIQECAQAIDSFLQRRIETRMVGCGKTLNTWRETYARLGDEFYGLEFQLADEEESLRSIEAFVKSERSFGDEFERIMRMEGVRKLFVQGDVLVVLTKRLVQTVNSISYDIGQHVIKIAIASDPSTNNFSFDDGPYLGEYKHPHATATNPCFGNASAHNGLNSAITKLLADCRWTDVIHLALTFLRRDNAIPNKRTSATTIQYDEALETGFASEEERTVAKEEFIKLYESIAMKRYTVLKNTRIKELRESFAKCEREFPLARQHVKEVSIEIASLEGEWSSKLLRNGMESAPKLAAREEICGITCKGSELHILFTANGKEFTFKLTSANPPRASVPGFSNILGHYSVPEEDFRRRIVLLREGQFAEFFDTFYPSFCLNESTHHTSDFANPGIFY